MMILALTMPLAHAGYVVPNIKWNNIEPNESGAAAALTKRANNISLIHTNSVDNFENIEKRDTAESTGVLVEHRTESLVTEIYGIEGSSVDNNTSEYSSKVIVGAIGVKASDDFTFGLNGYHAQFGRYNAYSTQASANYLMGDLVVGAGANRSYSNSYDAEFYDYYVGVGIIKEKMAFEAVLKFQNAAEKRKEKSSSIISQDKSRGIEIKGTLQSERLQISPVLSYTKEEDELNGDDSETTNTNIGAEVEYNLDEQFYAGFNLGYTSSKYEDNKNSSNDDERNYINYGLMARFKSKNYQTSIGYSIDEQKVKYNDGTSNRSEKGKNLSIFLTYFY